MQDEDENSDEFDKGVLETVKTYGWMVILIPEDEEEPEFAFSIGLYQSFNHPEIVIFGLNLDDVHKLINNMGDLIKAGTIFERGKEYSELLEGYSCTFGTVAKNWYPEYLGYARWFYKGSDFPVLQCFWPDKNQHYPWDNNFEERLRGRQPLLF